MIGVEPEELAEALRRLAKWAEEHAPAPESAVRLRLQAHLGGDPRELPVVSRPLSSWDRPNFQVAIDEWSGDREVELLGLPVMQGYRAGIAELARGPEWLGELQFGAVEHTTVPLGERESITCVLSGVWLARDGGAPVVVMLRSDDEGMGERLVLEVMASTREAAEHVVEAVTSLMRDRNVYRGRVLELGTRHFHGDESAPLTVHSLPRIARDRIVLPDGVLERIERHAFAIADHAARLKASGRHLRRGLLLYGPPGTGKTLTAMYLAGRMPDRTTVMLTGRALEAVRPSIDLATALQPSMVVLEDVDLVAMDRSFEPTNAVLFELLNGMDGLDDDHDVLFVLSTNRPDLLEPALASRPGRVDEAVELPLPDAEGRRRLIGLYGEGLGLELADDDPLIGSLEGVSPAFVRELLRRAALSAAQERPDGELVVTAEHLRTAAAELRESAGELTNALLGARPHAG